MSTGTVIVRLPDDLKGTGDRMSGTDGLAQRTVGAICRPGNKGAVRAHRHRAGGALFDTDATPVT